MKKLSDVRLFVKAVTEMRDYVGPTGQPGEPQLVGMGLRTTVSTEQLAFYIILVVLGILGNATVILVIGKSVITDRSVAQNSNVIIINMAVSNLMVSIMRNALLVVSDLGIEVCVVYFSKHSDLFTVQKG